MFLLLVSTFVNTLAMSGLLIENRGHILPMLRNIVVNKFGSLPQRTHLDALAAQ